MENKSESSTLPVCPGNPMRMPRTSTPFVPVTFSCGIKEELTDSKTQLSRVCYLASDSCVFLINAVLQWHISFLGPIPKISCYCIVSLRLQRVIQKRSSPVSRGLINSSKRCVLLRPSLSKTYIYTSLFLAWRLGFDRSLPNCPSGLEHQ